MSKPSSHSFPQYSSAPKSGHYTAHRQKRRKHKLPLVIVIAGALLFFCGFFLGKTRAESDSPSESSVPTLTLPQTEQAKNSQEETVGVTEPVADEQEENTTEAEWNLILVNGEHPLPEDFQVPELTQLRNGQAIDSRVYPALQEMMDAARAEGLAPLICSSYRTWDKQEMLFANKVQSYLEQGDSQTAAEEQAAYWVARPGTSEHQAGLAVDIVDTNYQLLDAQQAETPVQLWLMEHCAEYGFILRYPTDKSDLTGVGYEPWHYRYVGIAAATEIMELGICLEEYLQKDIAR